MAKKQTNKPRYTPEQVAEALADAGGIVTVAAARLGCHRKTVYDYIKRYASVRAAMADGRERTIDLAEAALFNQIRNGNITAIIFTLKTIGASRGYAQNQPFGGMANDQDWLDALSDIK